jgi:hypothetical protein
MRFTPLLALAATLPFTAGCHSRYVEATITNHSGATVQLLEVDYPSASFGTQNLAPEGVFHYRFKVLGSGPTKMVYTDAAHHEHSTNGPALKEGDEGRLTIELQPSEAEWKLVPVTRP